MSRVGFEGVTPVLRVADLKASLAYYLDMLGFTVGWQSPVFAHVSRGKCRLFLCQGDQGAGKAWIFIGVEDVDALYAEYQASGAVIRHPPANYPWAAEMQVEDPDGNVLRMGSDRKSGTPIGDWLDADGKRWRWVDGNWADAS
jgi:catechol 2,3-dioxygenase-like lactoylglutathione lyase family enzyme